eukprot:2285320-Pyramimonas_sp.AAC.1
MALEAAPSPPVASQCTVITGPTADDDVWPHRRCFMQHSGIYPAPASCGRWVVRCSCTSTRGRSLSSTVPYCHTQPMVVCER